MEQTPEIPANPMTLDQIRGLLLQKVEMAETEADLAEYQERLTGIQTAVSEMFTRDLLEQSETWHTLKGSSLPEDAPRLPEHIEVKVALVITNLLQRNF